MVPVFECNLASDSKCLILFNSEANQVSFPERNVRKWDTTASAPLADRYRARLGANALFVWRLHWRSSTRDIVYSSAYRLPPVLPK